MRNINVFKTQILGIDILNIELGILLFIKKESRCCQLEFGLDKLLHILIHNIKLEFAQKISIACRKQIKRICNLSVNTDLNPVSVSNCFKLLLTMGINIGLNSEIKHK